MTSSTHARRLAVAGLCAAAALTLSACAGSAPDDASPGSTGAAGTTGQQSGCITDFDPDTDYFADKAELTHAENLTIEYHRSYKVLTVKEPAPGQPPAHYVLVQCGAPEPQLEGELAGATRVSIPVQRVAANSTTQVMAYELLDHVDALVGVGLAELLSDGPAKQAVADGRITAFNSEGMGVNVEQVSATKPDLFVASATSDPTIGKVAELGIPVVAQAEWSENTLLGRAEWIDFVAALLNEEKKADEVFGKVVNDYEAVKAKVADPASRPTVLLGSMTSGVFHASDVRGYPSAAVRDAGGQYVFTDPKDTPVAGTDLEVVLTKARDAQFWLNAAHTTHDGGIATLVKDDPRLAHLAAVKNGNVWAFTKKVNAAGGNDYWQLGVYRPDLVLGDLAAILHPDLMPSHEFTFYEKLPAS